MGIVFLSIGYRIKRKTEGTLLAGSDTYRFEGVGGGGRLVERELCWAVSLYQQLEGCADRVVCCAVCGGRAGQRLLQWEGVDDSQGPTLMKEWHEHLDI